MEKIIIIEITTEDLNNIITALSSRRNKKAKRAESWARKKATGLIVPREVADAFIVIDTHTCNAITPLIQRLGAIRNAEN